MRITKITENHFNEFRRLQAENRDLMKQLRQVLQNDFVTMSRQIQQLRTENSELKANVLDLKDLVSNMTLDIRSLLSVPRTPSGNSHPNSSERLDQRELQILPSETQGEEQETGALSSTAVMTAEDDGENGNANDQPFPVLKMPQLNDPQLSLDLKSCSAKHAFTCWYRDLINNASKVSRSDQKIVDKIKKAVGVLKLFVPSGSRIRLRPTDATELKHWLAHIDSIVSSAELEVAKFFDKHREILGKKNPWCENGKIVSKLTASAVANRWNKISSIYDNERDLNKVPLYDEYEIIASGLAANHRITSFLKQ